MSAARQFVRSSGIMLALYLGATGLSFLSGVLLARLLGAEGYGIYALALTTATLVGMITEFGLPVLVLREVGAARVSNQWGPVRGLFQWSNRTILLLAAVLIAGTYLGHGLFTPNQPSGYLSALLWSVLLIPFVAFGKLRSHALLALDRVTAGQFPAMILRPVLFLLTCLGLVLITGRLTPAAAMAAQVAGAAGAMAVIFFFYHKVAPPELATAQPVRAVKSWLATSLPMGMTEGLRLLQGQLGLLLAGALAGTAQAGLYRVADAVAAVTALFVSVAGTAATPMFGRLWKAGDRAGLERVTLLASLGMTGGTFLLGLPIVLAGKFILPFVFGAQFGQSYGPFLILWGGIVCASMFGQAFGLANMIGRHVLATQSFAVIAVINVIVATALIPRHGASGAAVATVCGNLAGVLYCASRLWREERLNPGLFTPRTLRLLLELAHFGSAASTPNPAQEINRR